MFIKLKNGILNINRIESIKTIKQENETELMSILKDCDGNNLPDLTQTVSDATQITLFNGETFITDFTENEIWEMIQKQLHSTKI